MKLKRVGFFSELPHGDNLGMSLKEAIRDSASEHEDKIVEYLCSGVTFCITPGLVSDALDESRGVIGNLEILTDGTWAWPSDLSYYVNVYHIELDNDFIEHIKNNDWTVQNKKNIDLLKLEL